MGIRPHSHTRPAYEFEAQAGVEPAHGGFANRSVNHFTTGPYLLYGITLGVGFPPFDGSSPPHRA